MESEMETGQRNV